MILFIPLVKNQKELITSVNYEELYDRASVPLQRVEDFLISYRIIDNSGFLVESLRDTLLDLIRRVNLQDIINVLISFHGQRTRWSDCGILHYLHPALREGNRTPTSDQAHPQPVL